MKHKIIWIFLSCLVALTLVAWSCSGTPSGEQEEEEEEPASEQEEEDEPVGEQEEEEEEEEGLAIELALEPEDLGQEWERSGQQHWEENWIDQSFSYVTYEDDFRFSQYATLIVRIYPDAQSTATDSDWGQLKAQIAEWEYLVESYLIEHKDEAKFFPIDDYPIKQHLEWATLSWSFWDESYRSNDIKLRKDNILVFLKCWRGVGIYNPLTETYRGLEEMELSPEQKEWINGTDRMEFLRTLSDIVQSKIIAQYSD